MSRKVQKSAKPLGYYRQSPYQLFVPASKVGNKVVASDIRAEQENGEVKIVKKARKT